MRSLIQTIYRFKVDKLTNATEENIFQSKHTAKVLIAHNYCYTVTSYNR